MVNKIARSRVSRTQTLERALQEAVDANDQLTLQVTRQRHIIANLVAIIKSNRR
jgi:acid stress-induced BolA-like protein IbaG/YrbA